MFKNHLHYLAHICHIIYKMPGPMIRKLFKLATMFKQKGLWSSVPELVCEKCWHRWIVHLVAYCGLFLRILPTWTAAFDAKKVLDWCIQKIKASFLKIKTHMVFKGFTVCSESGFPFRPFKQFASKETPQQVIGLLSKMLQLLFLISPYVALIILDLSLFLFILLDGEPGVASFYELL